MATSDAELCTNVVTVICSSIFLNRIIESSKYSRYGFRSISELKMPSSLSLLLFLGICLELISIGFRSLSLGFRFLANLSAGHVLSDISFVPRFSQSFTSVGTLVVAKVSLLVYEFAVLCIQVSVLLALMMVYADVS